jgi:hypothetical protein
VTAATRSVNDASDRNTFAALAFWIVKPGSEPEPLRQIRGEGMDSSTPSRRRSANAVIAINPIDIRRHAIANL